MRGKVFMSQRMVCVIGITPAYAGKSINSSSATEKPWDHPRLCGEKTDVVNAFNSGGGSPPPMRGKGPSEEVFTTIQGITPAYAGKSAGVANTPLEIKDHPRLCGEKPYASKSAEPPRGSPPPMRGKVSGSLPKSIGKGITPAYAGKSITSNPFTGHGKDHPRLCGEKFHNAYNSPLRLGSPPPMRGKVQQLPDRFRFFGITPAYAGKSFMS